MTHSSPVFVEVNVQDCFFTDWADLLDSSDAIAQTEQAYSSPSDAPVSDQTWEAWFQNWLSDLRSQLPESPSYELSLRLTSDAEIQTLNGQYRHKNQPTDVLAFAALEVNYPQLAEIQAEQPLYLGDIVISVETAQRQAAQFGHSLQNELAWLAAHALLHLLGWDHPDRANLTRMLKQQALLLQTVGIIIDYHQVEKSIQQAYQEAENCEV
ncbi:MAG: hypothetical protein Kow00121_53350 [Elainellaceae cyanobacterium]